ncbi:L-fucose:H+ symporter permease [Mucilaginibacter daejeonensis]|uniref:L-fucose:H+ symporter permease n=1 Tax=Mucilaginibacter daejeonensis TaxID=398049 RepID=UPI001D176C26|nr:L-fucose:H+ symporter permease [Mucilaginibacter daejeonensis]UEG55190.1 L-fucose:H+ symporter permease [Mucilaginibacter daejeonensis]
MTVKPTFTDKKFLITLIFVTSLFAFWGIAISLGDVLNRHFQQVLHVSKAQSGLVQFSIFGAYFIMGVPAGLFMKRFGYKNGVLLGLALFAIGSFLFVPAANAESFTFFRIALFVLGCGLSTLETVAHPFVASLGHQDTSDQRINFAQSFNALGTIIGPLIGSQFIFNGAAEQASVGLDKIKLLYIIIGAVIAVTAFLFAMVKVPAITDVHGVITEGVHAEVAPKPSKKLFQQTHFVWAVIAQLFNVAAQAGTWAFFINYGHDKMGLTDSAASGYMIIFMIMMLAGRFIGTYLMRFIAPNKLLAAFALGNIIMCLLVAQGLGWISFAALFMINFFFSIMFPTIFSLGIKGLGQQTQQASSFISMAVVGGAIFPIIMGKVADHDVATAYYLPIICYTIILLFATKFYKVK